MAVCNGTEATTKQAEDTRTVDELGGGGVGWVVMVRGGTSLWGTDCAKMQPPP